jgi:hypothetical protein
MAATFQPPANLKDFDRSASRDPLYAEWDAKIRADVQSQIQLPNGQVAATPAFYDPLNPPAAGPPATAAPEWTGLPRTVKRLFPGPVAAAAAFVDKPVPMGRPDPMQGTYTPPFFDAATGAVFPGPMYRPQDEYLEWVTRTDPDGTIREILFTCEGPEYWDHIAEDAQLLVELYRELVGDRTISKDDLLFPRRVRWDNPNDGKVTFEAGQYNPYNRWNMLGAVHLTQPANTLGAEIALAKQATLLYGNPAPVTADPDLICCAEYGGINRMSDPTIGSGVNAQVRLGNRVSLRNPIGLYVKRINTTAFSLPDDSPFLHVADCFEVLRPAPADVTDMVVRARFRVPPGLAFNGAPLRVGDLKVNGEKVTTGGQVADVITMTLYAQALPGAPPQRGVPCFGKPCPDRDRPELITLVGFGEACPGDDVSPLAVQIDGHAVATAPLSHAAPGALAAVPAAPPRRFAASRVRRFPS